VILFTSDSHFNHGNILAYEPWRQSWARDVSDMNDKLVEAWNAKVKPDDTVYHLGDFCFGNEAMVTELRKRLVGNLILVRGNHDRSATSLTRCGVNSVKNIRLQSDTGLVFECRHNPRKFTATEIETTDVLLHGHLHGHPHHDGLSDLAVSKLLDVGVDATRCLSPLTIGEVSELFMRKTTNS